MVYIRQFALAHMRRVLRRRLIENGDVSPEITDPTSCVFAGKVMPLGHGLRMDDRFSTSPAPSSLHGSQDIYYEREGLLLGQADHKRHIDQFAWAKDSVTEAIRLGHGQARSYSPGAAIGILE